jgi:hypothetical protein
MIDNENDMATPTEEAEVPTGAKRRDVSKKAASQKSWADRSPAEKAASIVLGVVNIILVVLALLDLRRRPASEINGKKWVWVMVAFIQPFGPIAYFIFGRKRH